MRFTEGVKLSGKQTSTGQYSGETIKAPKGINLSGKRTEKTCKLHAFSRCICIGQTVMVWPILIATVHVI
jgi:hypothetical protein